MAAQLPQLFIVVIVCRVGFYGGVDGEAVGEFLKIDAFLEGPSGWVEAVIDFPQRGHDAVADDARVGDERGDVACGDGRDGVAAGDGIGVLLLVVSARRKEELSNHQCNGCFTRGEVYAFLAVQGEWRLNGW